MTNSKPYFIDGFEVWGNPYTFSGRYPHETILYYLRNLGRADLTLVDIGCSDGRATKGLTDFLSSTTITFC